jgi:hypothetical protein
MSKIHCLIAASMALCASVASAQNIVLNTGSFSSGSGGEFNATVSNTPLTFIGLTNSGAFETFCLERSENFQPGSTYFFEVSNEARSGGGGSVNGADPLDARTAYLYSAFIMGVLPNYDYANAGNNRQGDAGALQNAIWYIEEEVGSLDSAQAVFFYNFAQAGAAGGLGDVVVLNLYSIDGDGNRSEHQSQIAMLPTPGSLALVGLGSVVALRRRR